MRKASREINTMKIKTILLFLALCVTMGVYAQQTDKTFTVKGVSFVMKPVAGGTFQMGATPEQGNDALVNERPVHDVTLSSYYIGQTEVTQALWTAVMGSVPSMWVGDNLPVETVSWNDCQTFITKLNQLTGQKFRLPTEAEWEYAARGGKLSKGYKFSGNNIYASVAWDWKTSSERPQPVATKTSNELGIYDMSGNAQEWCQDWFGFYSSSAQTNPTGPSSGYYRVCRGGSCYRNASDYRVSHRSYRAPSSSSDYLGLRLVLPMDGTPTLKQNPQTTKPVASKTSSSSTPKASGSHTFTVGGVSFVMMPVEGGTFQMGATPEQGSDVSDDEKPVHNVTLSSYYIGQTEVTWALWRAVMGTKSRIMDDVYPVEQVSWDKCQKFIRKLNELTGQKFRLPTEAEWEYAARGGKKSKGYQFSGSEITGDVAWTDRDARPYPVASKRANELDLYDMSGNVSEWCEDWYTPYSSSDQTNPIGQYPGSGQTHVKRGGSFYDSWRSCRVSHRSFLNGEESFNNIGFRLALSKYVPPTQKQNPKTTKPAASKPSSSTIPNASSGRTFTAKGISFTMMPVEGGTFQMGATPEQGSDAQNEEKPVHSVTLSSFSIGQTEVTQALWQAVMGSNPCYVKGDNRGVEEVSWEECQEFITKLNQLTGQKFRLPTEAEWEYAARGGKKSKGYKYSGSNTIDDVAWYYDICGESKHVATKLPNELGLYDMSGSWSEWCQDWYGDYSSSAQTNPTGPSSGSKRVVRGGCFRSYAKDCRVSHRYGATPSNRSTTIGFRLVLPMDDNFSLK